MKIDLPALSLALQRASLGVKRTKEPSSGAALLSASGGLLRVSRTDGHVLSDAECHCEGNIQVAVDADRLKELLRSSTGSEAVLTGDDSWLRYSCSGVKSKLKVYEIATLPRHSRPALPSQLDLAGDLGKKLLWAQKLTQESWGHNQKPFEHVVVVEWSEGAYRGCARNGGSMLVAFEGKSDKAGEFGVCVNKSLIERIPADAENLAFSDHWVGFWSADSATFEPRIDCPLEAAAQAWRILSKMPNEGTVVDPKALAAAISGAEAVCLAETRWPAVTLTSGGGELVASAQSWAGEYFASVPFEGPEWKGTFSADLVTKIVTSLKAPKLAMKDMTLWVQDGPYKVALQGMRQ